MLGHQLQQFRQKKDGKDGGSHGKSSSKIANPGNEGESKESSKLCQEAPISSVNVIDSNLPDASTSGADQRAEELGLVLEQLPVDFDNQVREYLCIIFEIWGDWE